MSKYSLWLLPDHNAGSAFTQVIRHFAQRFSTPVFVPHLTLYGGIQCDNEQWLAAQCRKLSRCAPLLELHSEGIEIQEEYFRSLYVRIRNTEALAALFEQTRQLLGGARVWEPHISLVYGELSRTDKELALSVGYPPVPTSYMATSLALVDTARDVVQWRSVAVHKLMA